MDQVDRQIHSFIGTLLASKEDGAEFSYLMGAMHISKAKAEEGWRIWDKEIKTYSNEIYSADVIRFVMHLHNALPGSWHQKRQASVQKIIRDINPGSIFEIGFGTPQSYVKDLLRSKRAKVVLAEKDQSALHFARILLMYWDPSWTDTVSLLPYDLEEDLPPEGYDVYLFQDVIEHALNPAERIQKYAVSFPKGSHIVLSLPIEVDRMVPEHHIFWKDEEDVSSWLAKTGLKIISLETIPMNLDVDIFARSLHADFREVVILATTT